MVKYDYTYSLAANQGDSKQATANYIIAHETGNANNVGKNSAQNEAIYMKGHWQSAYTHAIAGHDRVYIVGEPGYVAYGAGTVANGRSPFQIELARYSDHALAIKAYHNYVEAIREYCKKYGISTALDGAGNGVKSHKWVSDNLWGDHQDPYAYLSSIGISKAQFASDLKNGFGKTQAGWHEDPTKVGVVTVNYSGKGGVRLLKLDDSPTNQFVKDGSRWKVFGFNDGGVVVSSKSYLPYQYAKIKIDYTEGYGVNAYTKDLQHIDGSNKKFKTGTSWKVVGGMIRNGKAYFKVSNTEYILGVYTN